MRGHGKGIKSLSPRFLLFCNICLCRGRIGRTLARGLPPGSGRTVSQVKGRVTKSTRSFSWRDFGLESDFQDARQEQLQDV